MYLTLARLEDLAEQGEDLHPDLERFAWYLDALGHKAKNLTASDLERLSRTEQEHFLGKYASPAEFAEKTLVEVYGKELSALPLMIQRSIDWAAVWDKDYRHDCLTVEVDDLVSYHWLIWHIH